MIQKVVLTRFINAPVQRVYDWFYHSENFTASPIVFISRWNTGRWESGSIRDVVMIAGWYREEITAAVPGKHIDYRVVRSIPAVSQEFTRIHCEAQGSGTLVTWTIELQVPLPAILPAALGSAMTKAGARMAGILYGSIMGAAARALET
ncbi:MAG: SRPBCC family protein [Rothia sp. (in: high G+C Gram-positive bacteria)]|uniref:SRPBCC family protein n=1 Tax=Rothia sp. (in: high G+C Gram-positive bacteria) TaxID=1885016 RepID=UPI0026E031D9|nr:SRPBCC family protein [Rothia sp. (in: high G+C Gram-positive bacteria)]MDO5750927.1 SRPBCC family protein [Rothia sp. (in: high G+C Gram-positive bacteria)]